MHRLTDAELVFRCLEGDADSYGGLVDRYQNAVYATAYYYVGRYGAAEDVAQEAFWAAYRSLGKLNDKDRFGEWLKGVTTRTAANWLRRNAPRMSNETPLPHRRTLSIEDARHGGDAIAHHADLHDRVNRAIDTLPERYRLPVVLRYLQEMNYEEISRFTGESPDEVRGILYRAVRQLREVLAAPGDSEEGTEWHRVQG